ncbi:MAG: hypothetical protein LBL45_06495 [Treponema sp.]|jgi:hypothetical protein|nr:hypothetical protein [Treponema sp.]
MNLNLGITPQTQAQQDLYRLAYHCAYSHTTVGCDMCATCIYNVHRYGYDPNEVELIKAHALMDYNQYVVTQKEKRKSYWQVEIGIGIVAIILILLIILGIPRIIDAATNPPTRPVTIKEAPDVLTQPVTVTTDRVTMTVRSVTMAEAFDIFATIHPPAYIEDTKANSAWPGLPPPAWLPAIVKRVINMPTRPATIEEATALVRQTIRDVNYDRKINCIDYAVVFYEIWPDSTIIRVWDNKELNHLLNMVDGKYIEPQVRSGDPHILWPTFDQAFKKDETRIWGYHWGNKRRW